MRHLLVGLGSIGGKRRRVALGDRCVAIVDPLWYVLTRGEHILVEMPLILDEATCEQLGGLARASGAIWHTSYNFRFEPNMVALGRHLGAELSAGSPRAHVLREQECRQYRGFEALGEEGAPRDERAHQAGQSELVILRRRRPSGVLGESRRTAPGPDPHRAADTRHLEAMAATGATSGENDRWLSRTVYAAGAAPLEGSA